ncbi:hypothetical protein JW906_13135 [bacterium]|nr:hypothetical protein [bacterium]
MKKALVFRLSFFCAVTASILLFILACGKKEESSLMLPQTLSGWVRSDTLQTVTSGSIFDYMDGAGELYIGYRFDRLEVSRYRMPGQDEILAEIYFMKSPDDAFGLLSLDWGGEPVNLCGRDSIPAAPETIPRARALYGAGLLRVWSGDVFARIMAYRVTPESKAAVMDLGRAVARSREPSPTPAWMHSLPALLCKSWNLERDEIRFLRTHLVLNSIYFLSYSNILELDLSTEIAAGRYRPGDQSAGNPPVFVFNIRYPSDGRAMKALSGFHGIYFPESPLGQDERDLAGPVLRLVEGKWAGFLLHGRDAALGFEFPDRKSVETALMEIVKHSEHTTGGQP